MKLQITPFTLRLKKPIQTARGPMDDRIGFQVAFTASGITGRGDAMPMASFGTETPEAAAAPARWCDEAANASCASRVSPSFSVYCSVEAPMEILSKASVSPSKAAESTASIDP